MQKYILVILVCSLRICDIGGLEADLKTNPESSKFIFQFLKIVFDLNKIIKFLIYSVNYFTYNVSRVCKHSVNT